MIIPVLLFIVGIILLIKGGDWFVDGATGIAHRFRMSELLIGSTVVSIGTTLPEVMVSATSAFTGSGGIAYGNSIGSIICNAALIAAITMAIRPKALDRTSLVLPLSFFFGAALVYISSAVFLGRFSRLIGILLLLLFVSYTVSSIMVARKFDKQKTKTDDSASTCQDTVLESAPASPIWLELLLLVAGAAAIAYGADLLVENGKLIATRVGIPESIVALIFVSLGTSLPELVTAITALIKGHSALSLGNIIGANLLNLTLVTGVAATVAPFSLPQDRLIFGVPSSIVIDIPVMLLTMLILTLPTMLRGRVSRVQGILLLLLYVAFCTVSFIFL